MQGLRVTHGCDGIMSAPSIDGMRVTISGLGPLI